MNKKVGVGIVGSQFISSIHSESLKLSLMPGLWR